MVQRSKFLQHIDTIRECFDGGFEGSEAENTREVDKQTAKSASIMPAAKP